MIIQNEETLIAWGEKLGHLLDVGDVLILSGDLGAGKTTFTKGLARGLDIDQMIKSPTYTIVREYEGRLPLYHLDVYRIDGDPDSIDLDAFLFGEGITVIEWGELLEEALPDDYLHVTLHHEGEGRRLELAAVGQRSQELMEAWKDAAARVGD
ncbi:MULTISPECIES: tRNA (adenosine(37)-N6)-threonylcarbamoyltransferase complex ATPase subunit type 1 TsaE [unclassified Streptococcus]|uniref:tRNA (adenosine(37)-N6)-threonylcarbamoyltransferase complex ATPase subunit type 1 TsaE n=1 Tax=unclassified Streptococcus TaxID=2608887 RepID=UPI001071F4EC|nr:MULTISPECIES: tRNA (adenosine(37)-N6)-threonylcarbamoyltransferase complex ATPase subunit type 1 TsaE [unclassified Streptococcus]MBF0805327.1 tRNA (adenosine(37)-N6)-threonylcarbamoyltransferase complex ATPase subunit type 1 TsaE [Streptococcus sp. 19428wA2_WM07]TFU29168.1 tRNA (adenosine(37)-N6)-threonylcarbamoyltransferase complex ATPase subunit type 1 TsaE [Streptococcus sp. WM07]